jgi:hypothetical protein
MSTEQAVASQTFSEEDIKIAQEKQKEGISDIRLALMEHLKRYNGYPFASASRIEKYPEKGEQPSILFSQIESAYLLKSMKAPNNKVLEDFMDTYGRSDVVYIQVHADCPTVGADGLYNAIDVNGKYIKTQLVGYFKLVEPTPVETDDVISQEGSSYFYKDQNDEFVNMFVNAGIPLNEWRSKHTTLYKAPSKVPFEPLIVKKQNVDGKVGFSMLTGNPYPNITPAMMAELLKDQAKRGNITIDDSKPEVEQE